MSRCMILSADAEALYAEVSRAFGAEFSANVCTSVDAARRQYAGEAIVLGDPDQVAEVLSDLPAVTWVQSTWAGVTPLLKLSRRDYCLTNIRGVFGPQIAEYVIGFLLFHELKAAQRAEHQDQRSWFTATSGTLQGKQLGIMGTGSIGRHIAGVATSLGINTVGLSRSGAPTANFSQVFSVDRLAEFLGGLDYLVSVLPDTVGTRNLLDREALAQLPKHAYFINVGRSNVVDDDALCARLRGGKLAGAALDVFDVEPLPPSSSLWSTPNLSVTAHIAAASFPDLIAPIFVENYRRFNSGKALQNVVDFDRGY